MYARAESIARERGLVLADTKFEFGRAPEIRPRRSCSPTRCSPRTPRGSGRPSPGCPAAPGQPSYDKQYVRDWLTSPASGWDRAGSAPPPPLPDEVVERTRALYVRAYEQLTGRAW